MSLRRDINKISENKLIRAQVILDEKGRPAFAVIPWMLYKRLSELDSDFKPSDEELYDIASFAG